MEREGRKDEPIRIVVSECDAVMFEIALFTRLSLAASRAEVAL